VEWRLLSSLGDEERRAVLGASRPRRYAKGETLFHEGDPGDTLHLLAKGRVAIRVTTPLGDTATLTVLAPGDYFGELAIVSPAPRNSTVVALEPVETLTLHRDQLEDLRRRHVAVDRVLLEALAEEVRRLSHRLLEALYVPADKRVLRRLVDLRNLYSVDGSDPVTIPLTQDDLAALAGTTRPTTNRVLRQAEAEGTLQIGRGRVVVVHAAQLAHRAR
jgi:CRP/FNR family transcriptional regulator, cyclic AMP receptor protein